MAATRGRQAYRRTGGLWTWLLGGVLLSGSLGGATAAALWGAGVFEPAVTTVSREGMVACPALARPVASYSAITREDLIDPQTRQLRVTWIPEAASKDVVLRDLNQIVGRVARRDKTTGSVLSDNDFFPKGTRPGIAAGIPPGKRAVSVAVEKIEGLELLRQGDTFDLVAALPPIKDSTETNVEYAALMGGIKPPDTRAGRLARQTGVKPLVHGGTMVALSQGKTTSTSGQQGLVVTPAGNRGTSSKQVVTATVAVDPEEVTPLTEALGMSVRIMCITHSGHPDEPVAEEQEFSLEGLVAVPVPVRRIEAYSLITQHDLADPVTGRLNVYYFPPDRIESTWLTDFTSLVGRVAANDVDSGMILTEGHLLPAGSPPGLSAAIQAGRRGVEIPRDRVQGLDKLSRGDRFDVLATIPRSISPPPLDLARLYGAVGEPEVEKVHEQLRIGLRTVASGAVVVQPAREDPSVIVVGIMADEVVPLTQALTSEEELRAVLVTGPADGADEELPLESGPVALKSRRPRDAAQLTVPVSNAVLPRRSKLRVNPVAEAAEIDRSQWPRYPVRTQPVAAFSELKIEHFIDPATGQLRVMQFPPDVVDPNWQSDVRKLLGRVVAKDLPAGAPVNGSDLLPEGSRAGPTAGIPPGYRALVLDNGQVEGLGAFQVGDHIDLLATSSYASDSVLEELPWWNEARERLFTLPSPLTIGSVAETRVLAVDALIVRRSEELRQVTELVTNEVVAQEMVVGATITRSGVTKSVEPQTFEKRLVVAIVAVRPEEINHVAEAIESRQRILSVARSGSPTAAPPDLQQELRSNEVFASQQGELARTAAELRTRQREDQLRQREEQLRLYQQRHHSLLEAYAEKQRVVQQLLVAERERLERLRSEFTALQARSHPVEHLRGGTRTQEVWLDGVRNPASLEAGRQLLLAEDARLHSADRQRREQLEQDLAELGAELLQMQTDRPGMRSEVAPGGSPSGESPSPAAGSN
ncbi:MAG: hypothetical protein ACK5Q5_11825 [Planctomycetaceae bacterium]